MTVTEPFQPPRPRLHFTPPRGWINDPTGLVRGTDGVWRLTFQYAEPDAPRRIGWGMAESRNLLDWAFAGMAIPPDADTLAYSGSIVRLEDGRLAAYHTRHRPGLQVQRRALLQDGVWVLDPAMNVDAGLADFRDPYVFRYGEGWRMLLAVPPPWAAPRQAPSRLDLWRSPNGVAWERVGPIGPAGEPDALFEVPVLAPIPVRGGGSAWLLFWSIVDRRDDGASCRVVWQAGEFDGERFLAEAAPQPLDAGPDFYAATLALDALHPGRRLLLGWVSSWDYARALPWGDDWAGGPLTIRNLVLRRDAAGRHHPCLTPLAAIRRRAGRCARSGPVALGADRRLAETGRRFLLRARLSLHEAVRVGLAFRAGEGAETRLLFDGETLTLDRGRSGSTGFHPRFAGAWSHPIGDRRTVTFMVLADESVLEIFLDDGRTLSALIFPPDAATALRGWAEGGAGRLDDLRLWRL